MPRIFPIRATFAILVIPFLTAGDSPQPVLEARIVQASVSGRLAIPEDQLYNDNGSSPIVATSLVEGGLSDGTIDGGGNITSNPLLLDADGVDNIPGSADDDVGLQGGSPAIDGGNNSILPVDRFDIDGDGDTDEPLPTDFFGVDRLYDPGDGTSIADMGAYETDAVRTGVESDDHPIKSSLSFVEPFPNPIRDHGELQFMLPISQHVEISVYDVLGRLQARLFDGVATEGREYRVPIDASAFGSGVCFFFSNVCCLYF